MEARSSTLRVKYLDIARTIAILSITVNHAVNRSFAVNSNQYAEFHEIPLYLTGLKTVIYAFSRIGVPLFLMISGALLLPRDYSGEKTTKFLKHNWLRLLVITELWLAIMFWYKQLLPGSILFSKGLAVCLVRFVLTLLFINPVTMGSMWYMEMILCVYLLIPLLSFSVKQIDFKYFLLPMSIVVFCSYILPDLNGILVALGRPGQLKTTLESANVFSMFVVCLLLGHFLNAGVLARVSRRWLWCFLVVSSVCFCLFQFWFFSREVDFVVGKGYHSIFVMLPAIPIFELLRRHEYAETASPGMRVCTELSRIAFGIYFIHICIMEGLKAVINRYHLGVTLMPKFLLLELVSFGGSVLLIKVLERNRWIAKYLLGIK